MLKKKNLFGLLNKSVALITFYAFLISSFNIPVYAEQSVKIINDKVKEEKIVLVYTIDIDKDILKLEWNIKTTPRKYFIFKKDKDKKEFLLASGKEGITENYYITALKINEGAEFVVCETPELPKLPDDIKIYSIHDLGQMVGMFKNLKGSEWTESNIIGIKIDKKYDTKIIVEAFKEDMKDSDLRLSTKQIVYKKEIIDSEANQKINKIHEEIQNTVNLDKNKDGLNDKDNQKIEGLYYLKNNEKNNIEYKGVNLEIPEDAVNNDSYIFIKPLTKNEIIKTPDNSKNLIKFDNDDKYTGYEISLNGDSANKFNKEIKISLNYDDSTIKDKNEKKNVFIYYFDEKIGQWKTLKRNKIDTDNKYITCITDHFCQFYAGTMSVQSEPPQAKGINTNPINIEKVDPMAGIKGLPEINPNNSGSLDFAYPVEVPEGINGMTPEIKIAYSGGNINGNCGAGWSLGVSSISIKIKNSGVPKYDGTEIFLLDGRELVKIDETTYRFKNEGTFSKIEKSGNSFIVHQTDGTKRYYGETEDSRLFNPIETNKIFTWCISKIVDKFGNQIKYEYEYEKIIENDNVVNLYVSKISYGYNFLYSINFTWENRTDIRIFYNSGFMIKNDKRLLNIIVKYNTTELKREELIYDANNIKSILTNIKEIVNGEVINEQGFEYTLGIYNFLNPTTPWLNDNEWGSPGDKYPIETDGGGITRKTLIDMNGDGFPDRVTDHKNGVSGLWIGIRLDNNLRFENPTIPWLVDNAWGSSGDKYPIDTYNGLTHKTLQDMNGDGLSDRVTDHKNGVSGLWVGLNNGHGFENPTIPWLVDNAWGSPGDKYPIDIVNGLTHKTLQDMNGDGLPDRVTDHKNGVSGLWVGLNNGHGFENPATPWLVDNAWGSPGDKYPIETDGGGLTRKTLIDMNGDGLPDRVTDHKNGVSGLWVGLNNGHGFENPTTPWLVDNAWGSSGDKYPIDTYNGLTRKTLIDMNGDGLPDRVTDHKNGVSGLWVGLNNGHGFENPTIPWLVDNAWGSPGDKYPIETDGGGITRKTLIDMNGDGLPDRVTDHKNGVSGLWVGLNNGHGFENPTTPWLVDNAWGSSGDKYPIETYNGLTKKTLIDMNGDGLPDRVTDHKNGVSGLWVGLNNSPNYQLTKITNLKTNSSITFDYKQQTIENTEWDEHFGRRYVLSSFTSGNADLSFTTTIDYENGFVDRLEKEFRGFEKVIIKQLDTVKNVTHITEKTYRVNDITGYDEYNNKIYDQYIKGQIDTVTKSLKIGENPAYPIGKEKIFYEKVNILTANENVKFVYSNMIKKWIYNEDGNFLGVDLTNGDISGSNSFTFDPTNGVISQAINNQYMDPHHNYDDVREVKDFAKNTANWINMPYKFENIDIRNQTRISLKTVYFDSQSEGIITNGKITSEKIWNNNGNDAVTVFETDNYGNVKKITTQNGLSINTDIVYNISADVYIRLTKTFPDGLQEITLFDKYGRAKEKTDIYGDISKLFYDNYGRIIKIVGPDDTEIVPMTEIIYDTNSGYFRAIAKYKDTSADGYIYTQFYKDGLGRDIQTKIEGVVNGIKVWLVSAKSQYDAMGRVIAEGSVSTADYGINGYIDSGMVSPITNYSYDFIGRPDQTETPSGLIIENTYGSLIDTPDTDHPYQRILSYAVISDNQGHERTVYKDITDQEVIDKIKKDNSVYAKTECIYDLHGYAKNIGFDGKVGEKQLDSLARLMWMKSPDAGKFEYVYNNPGQVVQAKVYGKNENDWRIVNYSYDSLDRITVIDYPARPEDNIIYTYYGADASAAKYSKSALKNISKGNYYSVEYEYGKYTVIEKKIIEAILYSTSYEYDVQGRIKTLTYPDGEAVNYEYNEGGYLKRIYGDNVYTDEIKYNEKGQKTYVKYGNLTENIYTYDEDTGLLDIFTVKDKNSADILKYDYDFNISGNLTKITDAPGSIVKSVQNYNYDLSGRLISANGDYQSGSKVYNQNYQYYNDDRIKQKTFENGITQTFNYTTDTHAMTSIDITNGAGGATKINFNFDDYGNITKKETLAGSLVLESSDYTYDENNRLININDGATDLNFKYDNKGARIKKVYQDGAGIISENIYVSGFYSIANGRVDKHISDGIGIIATKVGNIYDNVKFYHSNHIGSTAALTNKGGIKSQGYLFEPYGSIWVKEEIGDDEIDRLFTGQIFDQESGLYYYNARYYDPEIGMFMNPDPAMSGLNHYAYAGCNPVMYNDPTGLEGNNAGWILIIIGIVVAAIGIIVSFVPGGNIVVGGAIAAVGGALIGVGAGMLSGSNYQGPTSTVSGSVGIGSPGSGSGGETGNTYDGYGYTSEEDDSDNGTGAGDNKDQWFHLGKNMNEAKQPGYDIWIAYNKDYTISVESIYTQTKIEIGISVVEFICITNFSKHFKGYYVIETREIFGFPDNIGVNGYRGYSLAILPDYYSFKDVLFNFGGSSYNINAGGSTGIPSLSLNSSVFKSGDFRGISHGVNMGYSLLPANASYNVNYGTPVGYVKLPHAFTITPLYPPLLDKEVGKFYLVNNNYEFLGNIFRNSSLFGF